MKARLSPELSKLVETKHPITSIYFTAGYPTVDSTIPILSMLEESGIDLVEIGFPFSDPIADGPTIQESNSRAIENGMTLKRLLAELEQKRFSIPLILMGYINPILQYGFDNFLADAKHANVSGLIIPDLPLDWITGTYGEKITQAGLSLIPLITPTTIDERISAYDALATSFLYAVSSSAVTGGGGEFTDKQLEYLTRLKAMNLKTDVLVGFGIDSGEKLRTVQDFARGGIIGTAFIKLLGADPTLISTKHFLLGLKN